MSQEQVKQKIGELVKKYEEVLKSGRDKKYTEEETKKDFILPLFEALGWDVSSKKEVSAEEHIKSAGRVDYGFYLNGMAKFYLEAKKLLTDLDDPEYAKQAIKYAWNRGVNWAVLTNFEVIKVFNAQIISKELLAKKIFELSCGDYLEKFEKLRLLCRNAFENNELDKHAQETGRAYKRLSVTEKLSDDLNKCRKLLTDSFMSWNKDKVSEDLIDEGVQKLLDRLIFIKVAEDRGIEPPTLQPLLREWQGGNRKIPLFRSMISKFRELDETYDSNLFQEHSFEKWDDYDNATEGVIKVLYAKHDDFEYDFKIIPADVLGAVYENYLGYKFEKAKKTATISKDSKKRKEQGIYYTPTFIVDYIVRNALKPVLDKCHSIDDLKKIKVLDPACGSGSFLIKALGVICEKYKEFNRPIDIHAKVQILQENIYGVDLDEQAVEIARLNLLINCLDKRIKLPMLDKNIKNGNSLISGTDEELRKYFGKNYRDKKPFNWEEKFPDVFKRGGFDVIIGNPPYINVENLVREERKYLMSEYKTSIKRFDIYIPFIEKGLDILNKEGYLSFIIPYPFLNQNYAELLRKKILEEFNIKQIIDLSETKVFGDAVVRNCIIIVQKPRAKTDDYQILVRKIPANQPEDINSSPIKEFSPKIFLKSPKFMFRLDLDDIKQRLIDKIDRKSIYVGDICYINWGARSGNVKKYVVKESINSFCKKMINARNIERYGINYDKDYLIYKKDELYNPMFEELFESPKLIIRDISGRERLRAAFDDEKYYAEHTVSLAVPFFHLEKVKRPGLKVIEEKINISKQYDLKYVLGHINSRLVNWYFQLKLGGGLHVYPDDVKKLPVYRINFHDKENLARHNDLKELVNRITLLNREIKLLEENSNEWNDLNLEIEKTDRKIDEEVYKLYGLTPEEIKIIEGR